MHEGAKEHLVGFGLGLFSVTFSSGLLTASYAVLSIGDYMGPYWTFFAVFIGSVCNYLVAIALLALRSWFLGPSAPLTRWGFVLSGVAVVFLPLLTRTPIFFRVLEKTTASYLFVFGIMAAVLVLVVEFLRNLVARTKRPA